MFQSLFFWKYYLKRIRPTFLVYRRRVSILVLLEVLLKGNIINHMVKCKFVSILVLLEVLLKVYCCTAYSEAVQHVSILVLLEVLLKEPDHRLGLIGVGFQSLFFWKYYLKSHNFPEAILSQDVSILVLLEVLLKVPEAIFPQNQRNIVSILVLLEVLLKVGYPFRSIALTGCFNPCSSGSIT